MVITQTKHAEKKQRKLKFAVERFIIGSGGLE